MQPSWLQSSLVIGIGILFVFMYIYELMPLIATVLKGLRVQSLDIILLYGRNSSDFCSTCLYGESSCKLQGIWMHRRCQKLWLHLVVTDAWSRQSSYLSVLLFTFFLVNHPKDCVGRDDSVLLLRKSWILRILSWINFWTKRKAQSASPMTMFWWLIGSIVQVWCYLRAKRSKLPGFSLEILARIPIIRKGNFCKLRGILDEGL